MTIHAYQEIYLNKAQSVLGEAFDYAINTCGISGDDFAKQFIVSSISSRMENGEPSLLAGKSGIELAADIIRETTGKEVYTEPKEAFVRSPEYWIGWITAYYQWWSGKSFSMIFQGFSFNELHQMYNTLHEADVSKFTDIADAHLAEFNPETNLKRIRSVYGCSQAELAKRSGVGLRSIQMYEQRNKDINRASAETIYRLSKALGCSMEKLLEYTPDSQ